MVDAARIKRSDWERIERLSSLWDQVRSRVTGGTVVVETADSEVVRNPKRRARTPLKDAEVSAIRAAREEGEGVMAIAERFGVSRMTVWEKTRQAMVEVAS
ncbi:transcriptional regulator with PAS, ATPase and Fis domain [Microbacterium resistens]|uniref:Transcriptional regulator with PAS, ATPase and Fis domain n=1 Tax=Microbacterium resistens TaxID=156977 RepID=A0ABU1SHL3_9MICO|nr:helix-turn-helix domain-containing protein [Microbacterium resistens]MDR6868342.1 transcriptional regulator with PAS, ATPase and Fis domain [Microbacterium resistens]